MSVQEIEKAIIKLPPDEMKQIAVWISDLCAPKPSERPRVGEITSAPVICSEDCFAPLTDKEMSEWGFE